MVRGRFQLRLPRSLRFQLLTSMSLQVPFAISGLGECHRQCREPLKSNNLEAQTLSISSTPAQVINGVGAGGAWWPIDLYNFPESVREQAAELLFDSSTSAGGGAGFTSYRYNVGGGGVFVGNPS